MNAPPRFLVPPDTRERQRRAADPGVSVWVSANAGAGKTKVLTDRVVRLLLAGTAPSRILCLTFTKAAAAEMTVRVFKELGRWVSLPDAELAGVLGELTGAAPARRELARARRLFAGAVETPGGLKIETIHAFCERILHLVPFEADVPARFAVLDDAQAAELAAEARAAVLAEAGSRAPEAAALSAALEAVAALAFGDGLTRLLDAAAADERVPGDADGRALALAQLRSALGLRPGDSADAVRRAMLEGGLSAADREALAERFAGSGAATDRKQAERLAASLSGPPEEALAAYLSVFRTDKNERRKSFATKALGDFLPARLAAEADRLDALEDRLLAAETVERTEALFVLAGAVRARIASLKRRLGALDFADLIRKTGELLERGHAPWVLYRLDRGVDHVLLDEAQDTNPEQWRILRRLTEEFTAGAGRPVRAVRTVFAVGDPKQSIYSFQGADPRWFEDSRRHWKRLAEAAALPFADIRLDLSFRSVPAVLKAVDHTFGVEAHFRGLSFAGDAVGTRHEALRQGVAGQVEIWPTELPGDKDSDPDAWSIPVDEPERGSPPVLVARRVAEAVRTWISAGDETGRVWAPGEILILARKRGPAFFAAIRALKAAGVPVAGADRLDINEQIAVNDLVAAGGAALLPENDLVLASALKSPLVGLGEEALMRLALDRAAGESLHAAILRHAAGGDGDAERARDAVSAWRDLAARHGPFGFYATLLGPMGGRGRLQARLGGEAADAIDVFLCRAAAAETGPEAPSLATFLARFESAAHVIKRDPEAAGNEVRVMTVHGAKGLEAPLVVVLDGCDLGGNDPPILRLDGSGNGEPLPVWAPSPKGDCRAVAAAREAHRFRALEEHNRLLYVAMTRARDRLVIAPFAGRNGEGPDAWCAMVRRGFAEAAQAWTLTETPYGLVDLWADGTAARAEAASSPEEASGPGALPAWLREPVLPEPEPLPPLRPSGAIGAAERLPAGPAGGSRPGRAEARRRGILLHALLEAAPEWPAADRAASAGRFLLARAPGLPDGERRRIAADALAVLEDPRLVRLFGPGSRAEAAIAGRLRAEDGTVRDVVGQVDRLAIGPDAVLIADFKTGAPPPDGSVPDAYLAQLALYRALLATLHPDRPVRAFLVWTAGPAIVEPPAEALDRALAAALAAPALA